MFNLFSYAFPLGVPQGGPGAPRRAFASDSASRLGFVYIWGGEGGVVGLRPPLGARSLLILLLA